MDNPQHSDQHDKTQWEYYLIGLLMQYTSLWPYVRGILDEDDFLVDEIRQLYQVLSSAADPESVTLPLELVETVDRANKVVEKAQVKVEKVEDESKLVKEAIQCVTRLKRMRLLQAQTDLADRIDAAVRDGDQVAVQRLRRMLSAIQRELRTIDSATRLQG